jgi:hypothetical protein
MAVYSGPNNCGLSVAISQYVYSFHLSISGHQQKGMLDSYPKIIDPFLQDSWNTNGILLMA